MARVRNLAGEFVRAYNRRKKRCHAYGGDNFHATLLGEAIAREQVKREPIWTERLAIGSAGFVERIQPWLLTRRETGVIETAEGLAVSREPAVPYGHKSPSKSGAKNPN